VTRPPVVWPPPEPPPEPPPKHTVCPPRITVRQLNRRGACLDQVTRFRMRFGNQALVTLEACIAVCHEFDFEWATDELLHEPHAHAVWATVSCRFDSKDESTRAHARSLYKLVLAEEFARKYVSVYPNVP